MDRTSEILKQRLAARPTPGEHPAADLLSAFAEQTLRPSERERVIDHLGTCSGCRAVVAFALQDFEETPAKQAARPLSWFRFPVAMRWVSATAALAVAIGVGLLIDHEQPRAKPQLQTLAAKSATPAAATQAPCGTTGAGCEPIEPAAKPATASNMPVATSETSGTSRTASARSMPNPRPRTAVPHESVADAFTSRQQAPLTAHGVGGGTYRPAPAANAAVAQSSPVISGQPLTAGPSEVVTQPTFTAASKNLEVARESAQASAGNAGTARKREPAFAFNGGAIGGTLLKAPMAHWSLSVMGQLQRRNRDNTVSIVEPAPGATFRAVAAEGIEVWAGGSQTIASGEEIPVLFHSSDAGTTWKQVAGPWRTTVLRIQLGSGGSVNVSSADGQWQTRDGGQSWIPGG